MPSLSRFVLPILFLLTISPIFGSEPAPYPGVRVESGIMVFDDLAAFENTITGLKLDNQSTGYEYADQALDDFEHAMGFFSLRRHLLLLEENDPTFESAELDPDQHHVVDDYLATLVSPQHEILIGNTGYILSSDFTFELVDVSAAIMAQARNSDLGGMEVVLHKNSTKRTGDNDDDCEGDCDGWKSCRNYAIYDGGDRCIRGKIWIRNYPFYANAGGRTKHYEKNNNGNFKFKRADEISVSVDLTGADKDCNFRESTDFGDSKNNRKKVKESRNWWNQVTKATAMTSEHRAKDAGESCTLVLDLFDCDDTASSCKDADLSCDDSTPPTGLHIRTKFSDGDGTWTAASDNPGDGPGVHTHRTLVGDVDADGKDDLIFVGQGWSGGQLNIRVKRSNGDGTWTNWSQVLGDGPGVHMYPPLVGDVDDDGRADLIFVGQGWSGAGLNIRVKRSNGDGTWASWAQVLGDGSGLHTYPTLVGDVDGDGKDDLVFVGQGWSGLGLNIRVKRSNGDGTWTSWSQILGDGVGVHTHRTLIGDVDGDSRDDLVFVGQGWSGPGLNIRVKRSNGNGTWSLWSQITGDGAGVHTYPAHLGTVDGDARHDLIFVGQNWSGAGLNIRTKRSNGTNPVTSWSDVLGDGAGVHTHPALTGDFNGDNLTDIAFVGQNWSGAGLNIRTKFSQGNGQWSAGSQVLGDGAAVHTYPARVGDFDGDGRDDIVFVGQNW